MARSQPLKVKGKLPFTASAVQVGCTVQSEAMLQGPLATALEAMLKGCEIFTLDALAAILYCRSTCDLLSVATYGVLS